MINGSRAKFSTLVYATRYWPSPWNSHTVEILRHIYLLTIFVKVSTSCLVDS